jgi:glycosyltransferase involved in cell wall biosynthesis
MKNIAKISIVTPSFNQASFLEATIRSVINQNYPNLEYIIIDGGSTDGSVEIIKKYEQYLHFWCSEPDGGQYDAINKGFSHSTGEIMGWINSDDMYLPWAFKTVADIMSSLPNVQWLSTLNPGGWDYYGFCSGFSQIPGFSLEAFLDGCYLPFNNSKGIAWIQQESTFWHRKLWNISGGYVRTDLKLASDFDLWCRFYTKADLYGTHSPLGGFRSQYHQKSRNIEEYAKESNISLSLMRQSMNWKPNIWKNILFALKLTKIPKVKKIILSQWGYESQKIVRAKSDQPDSYWQIENYKF